MGHFEHRLMEVVVELLAFRADPANTVPFHCGLDLGPAHLDTGDQTVQRLGAWWLVSLRGCLDGTGQIVNRADQVAGKAGMTVFAGCFRLALCTAAHILDIGKAREEADP